MNRDQRPNSRQTSSNVGIDAKNCFYSMDRVITTGETAAVNLHAISSTNKPFLHGFTVTAELVHIKSEKSSPVDNTKKENNKHTFAFTPTLRGRHELRVSVNGMAIKPLPLFVTPHPTSLGNPTCVIEV